MTAIPYTVVKRNSFPSPFDMWFPENSTNIDCMPLYYFSETDMNTIKLSVHQNIFFREEFKAEIMVDIIKNFLVIFVPRCPEMEFISMSNPDFLLFKIDNVDEFNINSYLMGDYRVRRNFERCHQKSPKYCLKILESNKFATIWLSEHGIYKKLNESLSGQLGHILKVNNCD